MAGSRTIHSAPGTKPWPAGALRWARRAQLARQLAVMDCLMLLLVATSMLLFISQFLGGEHTFYIYDSYFWPTKARLLAYHYQALFSESALHAIPSLAREVWVSTADDYSELYALPLAPFLLLFSPSRQVYIDSVALLYTLPFALVVGALSAQLAPSRRRLVFWSGALLTLLTPTVWAATLRGYPDTGAALLLSLSIFLYLKSYRSGARTYLGLTGLFLALCLLFRRHFIYSVAAFLAAIALQLVADFAPRLQHLSPPARAELRRRSGAIGLVLVSTVVALAVLGTPFIYYISVFDYATQFNEAERMPVLDTIWYYGTVYGWLAWAAAATGFVLGTVTRTIAFPVAAIVALSGSLSASLWAVHARAPASHHGLNFALFVIVGLVALVWTICLRLHGVRRILAMSVASTYVVGNIVIAVGFAGPASATPLGGLLAAEYRPLVRDDYDEVVRIVDYLRSVARHDQRIYVAAASAALNAHTLLSAEDALYGTERFLQFIGGLDEPSPLSSLLQADYVVVANPTEYAGPEACGQPLQVVVEALAGGWGAAGDFRRLPVQFALGEGDAYPQGIRVAEAVPGGPGKAIQVEIYERWRVTPPGRALQLLRRLSASSDACPTRQPDWLILSRTPSWTYIARHDRYEFRTVGAYSTYPAPIFAYLPPIGEQVAWAGRLQTEGGACTTPAVRLLWTNPDYIILDEKPIDLDERGQFVVSSSTEPANGGHILLTLADHENLDGSVPACPVRIELRKAVESGSIWARFAERVADRVRSTLRR